VRLRYAYFVKCTGFDKDPATGEITAVHCTYDPATRGGDSPDGRKVKSTLHWVSAAHALPVEVRLYDHLFTKPDPDDVSDDAVRAAESAGTVAMRAAEQSGAKDWKSNLNPQSIETVSPAYVEPSVAGAAPGARYQFERHGYFCVDPDTKAPSARPAVIAGGPAALVFNRTVTLKDTWAKIERKQ
jgi:glutaminyl-tRNA synthetase